MTARKPRDTAAAVVRAAMAYWRFTDDGKVDGLIKLSRLTQKLGNACARHAAALKGKK